MTSFTATIAWGMAAVLVLEGCAATPTGPSVAIMPAPNKPFEVFQEDQAVCKQYADQQLAGQAELANSQASSEAVLSTLLLAGLGAALGGGRGAAVGAAYGALLGTGAGADASQAAQISIQQRYDIAYAQCMYSRGNQVPGLTSTTTAPTPG
ncbi:MAG: glycine zipper family protein [Alphaproteobacteria bacterium]